MKNLRIFLEVARHRSFSEAAENLGLTQSAASQRVHAIEEKLGVTLIDRSVRPLALTPAGEEFARGAQEILDRYEELERNVIAYADRRPRLEGHIEVAAIYSAGIDLLKHVRESFIKENPGVTVEVHYQQPEEVVNSVRSGRCDIGIVSYPRHWRGVGHLPLRDERMAVICAPTHPLSDRKRVHASDLARWPMVAFEPGLPVATQIRRYLKDHGVTPQVSNLFDNIDTVKTAVSLTDQIAILPQRTVKHEAQAGTLAVVELTPALSRPVGIVYRKDNRVIRGGRGGRGNGEVAGGALSPTAQAFVDRLIKDAGQNADLVEGGGRGAPSHGRQSAVGADA